MISPYDTEMASDGAVSYYGWEEFARLYVVLTGVFPMVFFLSSSSSFSYSAYISVIINEKLSVEIAPRGDSLFLGVYGSRYVQAKFSVFCDSRGADLISDVLDIISEQEGHSS